MPRPAICRLNTAKPRNGKYVKVSRRELRLLALISRLRDGTNRNIPFPARHIFYAIANTLIAIIINTVVITDIITFLVFFFFPIYMSLSFSLPFADVSISCHYPSSFSSTWSIFILFFLIFSIHKIETFQAGRPGNPFFCNGCLPS